MSKTLTIEQLKALPRGEWVWVVTLQDYYRPNDVPYGEYHEIVGTCSHYYSEVSYDKSNYYQLAYSTYGTEWLAYKNKQEAEGDIDYEIKYNTLHANVIDHCYKMDNKDYRKHFYDMTIGNRMQLIEESQAKYRGYSGFDEVKEMLSVIAGSKDGDLYRADSIKFVADELIAVLENLENYKANLEKDYIKLKNIVEQNNKLVWDKGEPIRKETAKEILQDIFSDNDCGDLGEFCDIGWVIPMSKSKEYFKKYGVEVDE